MTWLPIYGKFYDRDGIQIDIATWTRLFGDLTYKRISRTTIASAADPKVAYDVSTIWIGDDHNWLGTSNQPIIFETMVFGDGKCDLSQDRYATEAQARAGHDEMVAVVAATVTDPVVMDAADAEWEVMVPRGDSPTPLDNRDNDGR